MVVIRNQFYPSHRLPMPPGAAPSPPHEKAERAYHQRRKRNCQPCDDQTLLLEQMEEFLAGADLTLSMFCNLVGQSSNSTNGLFTKAAEGRLKPATVVKVRAFMAGWKQ